MLKLIFVRGSVMFFLTMVDFLYNRFIIILSGRLTHSS